jgi:hypothetical protein
LAGWIVELITKEWVVFTRGDEVQVIELRDYGKDKIAREKAVGRFQAQEVFQR